MRTTLCHPVSVQDAQTGKRIRIAHFERGAALCALTQECPPQLLTPQPILGYWLRPARLNVYVPGTMPAHLRTAAEEGCTQQEVLLEPLPAGIQEIDLTDCRREFRVLLHPATLRHLTAA
ncbi:hypothetical protein MUN82_06365 [Hymenobacter aerilatus]|uniref:Uncharacterized protein n=1 Tax=Hymenobacter aerilatus TaxID=2932251 RepID=A0A8T9SX99_9BACT|nr:hypothetical protein [Hymenobacter aerilatus]UOR06718.1 hypothetical protein MUN82_06365 [Hymenobacter aerilatus]